MGESNFAAILGGRQNGSENAKLMKIEEECERKIEGAPIIVSRYVIFHFIFTPFASFASFFF